MSKIPAIRTSRVNASKRIQNAARAFTANGLPRQTALNFKSGRPAGGPGSAWHAYFARKIVGRETNIHLSNPADNAPLARYFAWLITARAQGGPPLSSPHDSSGEAGVKSGPRAASA